MQAIFICTIISDSHKNLVGKGENNGISPIFVDKENEPQQETKSSNQW